MYTTPDTSTRVGRMLDGLLRSTNRKAKVGLTVDITKANGASYHQAFRVKAWDSKRDGVRMLTLDLNDGDWAAGTYATKVAHVNLGTGELRPAQGMQDKALLYAAQAAVHYAFTGANLVPGNGTVQVVESAHCGCCGKQLTHPVSIDLGIGPECAKGLGLAHHYKGTALTTRAKAKQAQQAAAPAAPAAAQQAQLAARAAGGQPPQYKPAGAPVYRTIKSAVYTAASERDDGGTQDVTYVRFEECDHIMLGNPIMTFTPGYKRPCWKCAGVVAPPQTREGDPDAACEHGSIDALACQQCQQAYLATLDHDIAATQLQHNNAANAGAYDRAERLRDKLDTLRGMRSKAVAEWQANHSLEAWEARVAAHPAAQQLPHTDQVVVARWCYVNNEGVEATLAKMGYTVAA